MRQQAADGVSTKVVAVAKQGVADWTALNADVVFANNIDEFRVHHQAKAVANTLCAHEDGIVKLRVGSGGRFAGVEVKLELLTPFLLELVFVLHQEVQVTSNTLIVIFFANQVVTDDHVGDAASFVAKFKLLSDLISTKEFKTSRDYSNLEQRNKISDVGLHVHKNLDFILDRNYTVVVKQTAENMANFDNRHLLANVLLHGTVKTLEEEVFVVVELERERELVLEVLPDFMIFAVSFVRAKAHLVLEIVVELSCILPVGSQSVDFHVAWLGYGFFTHFEEVRLFRVPDAVIIGQLDQEVS